MATIRQRKYAQALVENGGNKMQAAISAGYSPTVAKSAKEKIEDRVGFQDYVDTYLPYQTLFTELDYVLKQKRNLPVKNNAIRMGFQLRGKLMANQQVTNINVNDGYQIIFQNPEDFS